MDSNRKVPLLGVVADVPGECLGAARQGAAAVDQHARELRTEAADRDLSALAAHAVDGDAGDALQRLGEVLVRELADVLGDERVHDVVGVALHVEGLAQTAADAGDDDFLDDLVVVLLGEGDLYAGKGAWQGAGDRECDRAAPRRAMVGNGTPRGCSLQKKGTPQGCPLQVEGSAPRRNPTSGLTVGRVRRPACGARCSR